MEEKKQAYSAVKSVFRNGRKPTREEYTNLWIRMINEIERKKQSCSFPCEDLTNKGEGK